MRNKHSSTVTGTDLRLSVSHSPTFHLPSLKTTGLSEISDIEVKKKKKVIIQALSLSTIRQVSSAVESSGSTLRKHLAYSSQGRSEWIARLPRVEGYWSCLLKLIQRAHLQPYTDISRVSILEYRLAFIYFLKKYIHLYFFIYRRVHVYIYIHARN